MNISDNLQEIKNKIQKAEIKSGRKPGSVKLMAVSKFHPSEEIVQAINAGQLLFGENRVQEASEKFPSLFETYPNIDLQLIGQLQTNKVKNAVKIASCIQSVDRLELIKEIEKQCAKIGKKINILFEIHTGEASKSGYENIDLVKESLDFCAKGDFPHVNPVGFMTMAPFTDDEKLIRKSFITLRTCAENLQKQYNMFNLTELSMGMSGDFEIAIEEGSTMVRVGTAIFGQRDAHYSKK